jgi:hypothetical protein
MNKILKIINSCKTLAQLANFYDVVKTSPLIDDSERSYYMGALALKEHQLSEAVKRKQAEARFPVDDEMPDSLTAKA